MNKNSENGYFSRNYGYVEYSTDGPSATGTVRELTPGNSIGLTPNPITTVGEIELLQNILVNQIDEFTTDAGVTVENILLKNSEITGTTITGSTNNVSANSLKTSVNPVVVNTNAPVGADYYLRTTSATNATWQPIPIGDVTLNGVQTLTNKTLTLPSISSIFNAGTVVMPAGNVTVVSRTTTETLTNKTLTTPIINSATLSVSDTSTPSFSLSLRSTSNPTFSANRILTFDVNNANRTLDIGGNITTENNFTTSGAFSLTLTSTASTNVTLPTTGTLATLSGVETLSNKTLPTVHIGTTGTYATSGKVKVCGVANNISAGPFIEYFTPAVDAYPLRQDANLSHNNIFMGFDSYYDSSFRSSNVTTNFALYKAGTTFKIQSASGITPGNVISWTDALSVAGSGLTTFGTGLTLPSVGGTASTLNHYEEFQYTSTVSGTFSSTCIISIIRTGNVINMSFRNVTATCVVATGLNLTSSTLPARFRPVDTCNWSVPIRYNGVESHGILQWSRPATQFIVAPVSGSWLTGAIGGIPRDLHISYVLNSPVYVED